MTATRIRDEAGISKRYLSVIAQMVELGEIEACQVAVGNQKTPKPGYKLKENEDAQFA